MPASQHQKPKSDIEISQAAKKRPIMDIARLDASVEWKSLLRAKLVANFRLHEPKLHVNLENLREEAKDPTPVKDKGWQEAFEAEAVRGAHAPALVTRVTGFNINGGRRVDIGIYVVRP